MSTMSARAIGSATISFGLVSIPVKLYTATSSLRVSFNLLEAKTAARVKQQYVSTVSGEVVERDAMVKGYEFARGQFVQLTEAELESLETASTGAVEIAEFVPLPTVDFLEVEKSYYLGPDRGGDKAYQLLAQVMQSKALVAVARWAARGKDQLVLLRPYRDGLVLHQLYYANEMRPFDEVDRGATLLVKEVELELAERLVDHLTSERFDASKYADTYTERVRALVEQKVAGQEITVVPEAPKAHIIDLFEALKQSLATASKDREATALRLEPKPLKKAVVKKPREKKAAG